MENIFLPLDVRRLPTSAGLVRCRMDDTGALRRTLLPSLLQRRLKEPIVRPPTMARIEIE